MHFTNTTTVAGVRNEYRKLAMRWHPDRQGGDQETMKAVNAEYERLLESLNGEVTKGTDGENHTYYYNQATERAAMEKILEVLGLNLTDLEVEMIGTWVWVGGNTREHKEALKALSLRWHSKRQLWYWRKAQYRTRYSGIDTDELRAIYGTRRFENSGSTAVAA